MESVPPFRNRLYGLTKYAGPVCLEKEAGFYLVLDTQRRSSVEWASETDGINAGIGTNSSR